MAMPWSRAKALIAWYRDPAHPERIEDLNAIFNACMRIAAEAECPIVIENVRGAQPWVGRSRWNYGSYHLWGDVPALMPITFSARKNAGFRFDGNGRSFQSESVQRHIKNDGGSWFNVAHNTTSGLGQNPDGRLNGVKQPGISGSRDNGKGDRWFQDGAAAHGSKSNARKAAAARIAKIPLPLARHIARCYFPIG